MAQMKEQIKIPRKELSNKEINNLSDAEFKTLVIRMLTELIELGRKMKKQEFRKVRRGLRTSRTTLNIPTSKS